MNTTDPRYHVSLRPFTPVGWAVVIYIAALFGIPASIWFACSTDRGVSNRSSTSPTPAASNPVEKPRARDKGSRLPSQTEQLALNRSAGRVMSGGQQTRSLA